MDKTALSESDICDRYITPALERAGWATEHWRREYGFTDGKMIVRGKLVARGKPRRADYLLFHKPNLPIAVVEAKDNKHSVRAGMQQALDYAERLDVPFVFSSNGDGFVLHDKTGTYPATETNLTLELVGNDRAGIVREVTRVLSRHGISIDTMTTETREAPMAGGLLFDARLTAYVRPTTDLAGLRADLEQLAAELLVDLSLDA